MVEQSDRPQIPPILPPGAAITIPLGGSLAVGHLRFMVGIADAMGLDDGFPIIEEASDLDPSIVLGLRLENP